MMAVDMKPQPAGRRDASCREKPPLGTSSSTGIAEHLHGQLFHACERPVMKQGSRRRPLPRGKQADIRAMDSPIEGDLDANVESRDGT